MTDAKPTFRSPINGPVMDIPAANLSLADVSGVPIVLVQGDATAELQKIWGGPPPAVGTVVSTAKLLLARLTPAEFYLCGLTANSSLPSPEALNTAFGQAGLFAHATDLTHGTAVIKLSGVQAAEILSAICGLDFRERAFPTGRVQQTSAAKIKTLILRWDAAAEPVYYLHVARPLGAYFWEIVRDAIGARV